MGKEVVQLKMQLTNFIIMRLGITWITVMVVNLLTTALTIIRQIIGYGTTPKIESNTSETLKALVDRLVYDYNIDYLVELLPVGLILLFINFFLLKKMKNKYFKSLLLVAAYFIISVLSLVIISSNFKKLCMQDF